MIKAYLKIFLSVLIIVTLGFSVNAQKGAFKSRLGIGIHGGINFSDANFDEGGISSGKKFETIQRYSGGLFLNFMAEEYAGIQVEFNMSQRGWQEVDTAYIYNRNAEYFEIPVLTHLSFGKKRMRYIFNLGPYIAFHRNFTESIELLIPGATVPEINSENSYYGQAPDSPIDLGFMIDGGIGVNTSIGIFQVKARYSYGMVNVFDKYPDGAFRTSLMRNLYFGASYCYNFNFREED